MDVFHCCLWSFILSLYILNKYYLKVRGSHFVLNPTGVKRPEYFPKTGATESWSGSFNQPCNQPQPDSVLWVLVSFPSTGDCFLQHPEEEWPQPPGSPQSSHTYRLGTPLAPNHFNLRLDQSHRFLVIAMWLKMLNLKIGNKSHQCNFRIQ